MLVFHFVSKGGLFLFFWLSSTIIYDDPFLTTNYLVIDFLQTKYILETDRSESTQVISLDLKKNILWNKLKLSKNSKKKIQKSSFVVTHHFFLKTIQSFLEKKLNKKNVFSTLFKTIKQTYDYTRARGTE